VIWLLQLHQKMSTLSPEVKVPEKLLSNLKDICKNTKGVKNDSLVHASVNTHTARITNSTFKSSNVTTVIKLHYIMKHSTAD